MAWYIKQWPDNCDPRTACFGQSESPFDIPLPWRWWSEEGTLTPSVRWIYNGVWSSDTDFLLPELYIDSQTPGGTPSQIVWEREVEVTFPNAEQHDVGFGVVTEPEVGGGPFTGFSYYVLLDGVEMSAVTTGGTRFPTTMAFPGPQLLPFLIGFPAQFAFLTNSAGDHSIGPLTIYPCPYDRTRPGPPAPQV